MFHAFSAELPAVRTSAPGTITARSSMAKTSIYLHMGWGRQWLISNDVYIEEACKAWQRDLTYHDTCIWMLITVTE